MKKIIIVLLISVPMVGFSEGKAGGYKRPRYGMAGCGLGSMFISSNETWPQVGAAILNGIGYATSAMTTGTSNCTNDPSASAMLMEQQVFMASNYNSITKEAAQGTGEHLTAFAEVLGCDANQLGALTKANYSTIFVGEPNAALENVKSVIEKESLDCDRA